MKSFKIPEATVTRLAIYLRYLTQCDNKGISNISSSEIADGVGVSSAQVRKDLAYFGAFGTRGVGYNVKDLIWQINKILGININWPVVLVGLGNLGTAMASRLGQQNEKGFQIVGLFDKDQNKIGEVVGGITINPMSELASTVQESHAKIGIITVPAHSAQEVANDLVAAGIKAILNFAPTLINVPSYVEVRNVDYIAVKLEVLTFNLCMQEHAG